jgi:hypothetical protein
MRLFEFELKPPNGRIVAVDAMAESWQWVAAMVYEPRLGRPGEDEANP